MRFGIVGLGRIGGSLAALAAENGHEVVGMDPSPDARARLTDARVATVDNADALVAALPPPRVLLVYVPHGTATESAVTVLAERLDAGDVLVDGGNSHWRASARRHAALAARGIGFVDCGTSGGVDGARHGACFMVGGDARDVARVEPLLRDLAVPGVSCTRARRARATS